LVNIPEAGPVRQPRPLPCNSILPVFPAVAGQTGSKTVASDFGLFWPSPPPLLPPRLTPSSFVRSPNRHPPMIAVCRFRPLGGEVDSRFSKRPQWEGRSLKTWAFCSSVPEWLPFFFSQLFRFSFLKIGTFRKTQKKMGKGRSFSGSQGPLNPAFRQVINNFWRERPLIWLSFWRLTGANNGCSFYLFSPPFSRPPPLIWIAVEGMY